MAFVYTYIHFLIGSHKRIKTYLLVLKVLIFFLILIVMQESMFSAILCFVLKLINKKI